jgi:hypothetical protein
MKRSTADRRVHDFEADVATLLLVDPVINSKREALLREER